MPVEDSQHFYNALSNLRSADSPVHDVFVDLSGAHHAFNYLLSPRTLCLGMAAIDFLKHVHAADKATQGQRQGAVAARL